MPNPYTDPYAGEPLDDPYSGEPLDAGGGDLAPILPVASHANTRAVPAGHGPDLPGLMRATGGTWLQGARQELDVPLGAVKRAGQYAANLGGLAYRSPVGRVSDWVATSPALDRLLGTSHATSAARGFAALGEELQPTNGRQVFGGLALDVGSAFLPLPGAQAGLSTRLAATGAARVRAAMGSGRAGRLAARAVRGVPSAVAGAGQGAALFSAQTGDPGLGAAVGAATPGAAAMLRGAVMPVATRVGRMSETMVGQAIAPTREGLKAWVGKNAAAVARALPSHVAVRGLDGVAAYAEGQAQSAAQRIDAVLSTVRQGNVGHTVRTAKAELRRAIGALTVSGVKLAPKAQAELDAIVVELDAVNPTNTNAEQVRALAHRVSNVLYTFRSEVTKTLRVNRPAATAAALTNAAPTASVSARSAMRTGRTGLTDVLDEVEPSRVPTAPIIRQIERLMTEYQTPASAGHLVTHDPTMYDALERLLAQVRAHGPDMSVDNARKMRQAWDRIAAGAKNDGFLVDALGAANRAAARDARVPVAQGLADTVPEIRGPNADYAFHAHLGDAVEATTRRRVGQHVGGLSAILGGLTGAQQGYERGGLMGGAGGAAIGGLLGRQALKFIMSPNFKLVSAVTARRLSDALTRNADDLPEALALAQRELAALESRRVEGTMTLMPSHAAALLP
jgi:hypothetical protein